MRSPLATSTARGSILSLVFALAAPSFACPPEEKDKHAHEQKHTIVVAPPAPVAGAPTTPLAPARPRVPSAQAGPFTPAPDAS